MTGQRVLCVDDDARMRRAVANSLQTLGVIVEEASTPEEAITKAGEQRDIALVLTDYVLETMDGLELIGKLKALLPRAEYALMTGVSDINLLAGAVNSRAISFFVLKPWHADELRDIVRTALTQSTVSEAAATPAASPAPPARARPMSLLGVGLAVVALVVGSLSAWFFARRQARQDALTLASVVADLALAVPLPAISQLSRDGVTYVTVWGNDGELTAWAVDRDDVQVPGSDQDAALALANTASDSLAVAERASGERKVRAGVRLVAFEATAMKIGWTAVAACLIAAIVALETALRRRA